MATVYRGVSGVVAAMILLLMFVGIVLVYQVYMAAQQRIYEAQREAAQLQAQMQAASRAIILYYNFTKVSNTTAALLIYAENKGAYPVKISDVILEWGWEKVNITYNVTIIGNNTAPGTPNFTSLAHLIYKWASIEPQLTITVYYASGGNETLNSLPVTLAPGDRLELNISPLPIDLQVYTVSLLIELSLPGVGTVSTLVTPKVAGATVVYVATPVTPPTGIGGGAGIAPPPFDTITWVYGIPLHIYCAYNRLDWPTAVIVNFTAAGINYEVDPVGVRLLDLDSNRWVPVNVTKIAPNYMVIVFPLTCSQGQLRNFTIYAAGGPLAHPEGFYQVGLAKLWNGKVVWEHGVTYYESPVTPGKIDYIVLEAPPYTLTPISPYILSSLETEVAPGTQVALPVTIPYFDTQLSSLYVHSDIRLNESLGIDNAPPSVTGLQSSYAALAPAWLAAWKYKITITVYNPTSTPLHNVLVYIDTSLFPTPSHLFNNARSDGGDIIFVDEMSGALLDFVTLEYDPVEGTAAWIVKIPSLGSGQAKIIALYYGNPVYNKSIETYATNVTHLVEFLSDFQPPDIPNTNFDYYYVPIDLPFSSWNKVYAASDYASANITLGDDDYERLLGSFSFPFYGATYTISQFYIVSNGYITTYRTTDYTPSSWQAHLYGGIFMFWTDILGAHIYINASYSDEFGAGYLVRLYSSSLYGGPGPVNVAAIIYSNGLIRLVYGDLPNGAASSTRYTYIGVAQGNYGDYTDYYYGQTANIPDYHNDVLFVPTFMLATNASSWMPAIHSYNATIDASQASRISGDGVVEFHWNATQGLYALTPIDLRVWITYAGDILLDIDSLAVKPGPMPTVNVTIGFGPGRLGDPGIVLYSSADGIRNIFNFDNATMVYNPPEVLLLRYNSSYTVYIGKAVPMFPWVVGWLHGLRVIIHNPLDAPLVNYTVHVVLGADNLTNDYISSSLFGKDIRVLDEDGNRIPFWVYYYDARVPVIKMWVKVPEIPANGNATIYIYYDAQPPPGVSVKDESNPNATLTFYFKVGGDCPPMEVYNTTSYECIPTLQPGYPVLTTIVANLTPGDIVRFYSDIMFGLSALYGYEYKVNVTPDTATVDYDVVVELVPYGYEESPPTTTSYGVFFGHGVLGRLVGGSVNTTWDQGSVAYTPGSMYTVVIRINGSKMVTLVYNVSGLVASAVDSISLSGYLHAALTSYAVSLSGQVMYAPVEGWVRPWVYREPYVVSSVLLS